MDRYFKCAIAAAALAGSLFLQQARAVDLDGAWATNAEECRRVFIKKGGSKQIGFTAFSEQYGGGFIAEADRFRGKFATCRIKTQERGGRDDQYHCGLRHRYHAGERPIQPKDY